MQKFLSFLMIRKQHRESKLLRNVALLVLWLSSASAGYSQSITAYSTNPSPVIAGQQFMLNISGNNFNAATALFRFNGPGCNPCTVPNNVMTSKSSTLLIGPVTLNTAGNYTVAV